MGTPTSHARFMTSIEGWIATNGGFITRAQALDCGSTDRDLAVAVRTGSLIRIRHGVYSTADVQNGLDPLGRHVLLARAVVAVQQGEVALCGASAAAAHGLELHRQDLETVHLLRLDSAATRTVAGVKHHVMTIDHEQDLIRRDDIMITSLARTAWDVARGSSLEGAVITLDSALRARPDLEPALQATHARSRHHPGARTARFALALADGRAANGGESYARVQLYRYHVPSPELQVPILDHAGNEIGIVDFAWDGDRHVAEFDGKIKYQRYVKPGESPSDVVFREKQREDAIRNTGRGMTRFVWGDLHRSRVSTTMAKLRAALQNSRRLYVTGFRAS